MDKYNIILADELVSRAANSARERVLIRFSSETDQAYADQQRDARANYSDIIGIMPQSLQAQFFRTRQFAGSIENGINNYRRRLDQAWAAVAAAKERIAELERDYKQHPDRASRAYEVAARLSSIR